MLDVEEDYPGQHARRPARKRSQNGVELREVSGDEQVQQHHKLNSDSANENDENGNTARKSWNSTKDSWRLNKPRAKDSDYEDSFDSADNYEKSQSKSGSQHPDDLEKGDGDDDSYESYGEEDALDPDGASQDGGSKDGKDMLKLKGSSDEANPTTLLNSDRSTAAHMFISFVGAGVLGLPYAFMKTGLLGSIGVVGFVGTMSTYAMMLLVDCKIQLQQQGKMVRGYGDIAYGVLGPTGSVIIDFLLVLTQVAFCCAYVLFIGENMHTVMPEFSNSTIILLTIPGLSLLALYRHIKNLSPFALVADVANIIGMLVVISFDVEVFHEHELHMENALSNVIFGVVFANLPYFFGVAIYCYEGVGVILNIHESMQNKPHFRRILATTMAMVTSVYIVFGSLGYIAYADSTKEIITLNLGDGIPTKIVKVALSTGLFFTFPLMMLPVYTIIESSSVLSGRSQWVKSLVRVIVVFGAVFIAIGIPNFGDFISLVGAGACALLALILPAYFHLKLYGDQISKFAAAVDIFVIIVGSILGVIGTWHAGQELFSKFGQ
mmetsp:Transcript_18005/g.35447  ORF Transcript_18005/g.35447 Transcript_18005/m.35447 type:complete len:550 (-) Transcript_18005:351-2000(-)